jgi:hypothetical protein
LDGLRAAAREEGFEITLPDELNRVDKVGQFQQLVEQSEMNSDLKTKVCACVERGGGKLGF